MADTFTMDEAPADAPELNADEQESLAIGEEMQAEQQGLLAGKYSTTQDLENAYLELQQKLGSSEQAVEEAEPEVEYEPSEASTLLTDAAAEFNQNGELSADTMASLSQMSSEDLVNAYIEANAGNESTPSADLSDADISAIQNSVGGEEQYGALIDWAGSNLSSEQIEGFDSLVETGNAQAIAIAVAGLKAMYESANGYEGEMLTGKAPSTAGETFRSQAEVVAAMSDPRYDRDEAYREEVIRKLENSPSFF